MKTILIRTLGGENIGYGHFYRCLSLAKGLIYLNKEINIIFLVNEELKKLLKDTLFEFRVLNNIEEDLIFIKTIPVDLFIFDSYLGNDVYLKEIKKRTKLMLIDDNNDLYDSSIPDIINNGNIYAPKLNYKKNNDQICLLGTEYLLMKEEYWLHNEEKTHKEGIVVTTGGTDPHSTMIKILSAIKNIGVNIKAIIGPGFPDSYIKEIENLPIENLEIIYKPNSLKKLIKAAKIVITAGGSTVYEVISQKSIPIIFSIAANQDLICSSLQEFGVPYLGKAPEIDYLKLNDSLEDYFISNRGKLAVLESLVTGRGALLVAEEILRAIGIANNLKNHSEGGVIYG